MQKLSTPTGLRIRIPETRRLSRVNARCSTDEQDLTVQREGLAGLGVTPNRTYVDHTGLKARRRPEGGPDCGDKSRLLTFGASEHVTAA